MPIAAEIAASQHVREERRSDLAAHLPCGRAEVEACGVGEPAGILDAIAALAGCLDRHGKRKYEEIWAGYSRRGADGGIWTFSGCDDGSLRSQHLIPRHLHDGAEIQARESQRAQIPGFWRPGA